MLSMMLFSFVLYSLYEYVHNKVLDIYIPTLFVVMYSPCHVHVHVCRCLGGGWVCWFGGGGVWHEHGGLRVLACADMCFYMCMWLLMCLL